MLANTQIDAGHVSIENIPFPCMLISIHGELIDYNDKAEELFEVRFKEEGILDITPFLRKNGRGVFSLFSEMVQIKGQIQDFKMDFQKKKQLSKAIAVSGSKITDDTGNCYAISCVIRDISKDDMFLEQIKTELLVFRNFFEHAPMGVAIKIAGHTIMVNEVLEKMMGYSYTYLCNTYLPSFIKRNQNKFGNALANEEMYLLTGQGKRILADVRKFVIGSLLPDSDMEVFLFYDKQESTPLVLDFFTPSLHNCS